MTGRSPILQSSHQNGRMTLKADVKPTPANRPLRSLGGSRMCDGSTSFCRRSSTSDVKIQALKMWAAAFRFPLLTLCARCCRSDVWTEKVTYLILCSHSRSSH